MTDNETLARSIYEAWNDRDFDLGAGLTAPDAVITLVGSGETLHGPDGARQFATTWADAFPDGTTTIDRVVASGDYVVVEFTGRGTNTGTLATSMGDIPATGRSVTLQFCDVLQFRDEKLVAQHSYLDTGAMMAQLGVGAEQLSATKK